MIKHDIKTLKHLQSYIQPKYTRFYLKSQFVIISKNEILQIILFKLNNLRNLLIQSKFTVIVIFLFFSSCPRINTY